MARPAPVLHLSRMASPLGEMILVSRGPALAALDFDDCEDRLRAGLARRHRGHELVPGAVPSALRSALEGYFDGEVGALDAIPVALAGTPFQCRAWRALRAIPPGTTISYTELARRAGSPLAVRAAGRANALNPVSLVVPCHRVIGRDGSLTGYAGGIARKRWLLEHEGALRA